MVVLAGRGDLSPVPARGSSSSTWKDDSVSNTMRSPVLCPHGGGLALRDTYDLFQLVAGEKEVTRWRNRYTLQVGRVFPEGMNSSKFIRISEAQKVEHRHLDRATRAGRELRKAIPQIESITILMHTTGPVFYLRGKPK